MSARRVPGAAVMALRSAVRPAQPRRLEEQGRPGRSVRPRPLPPRPARGSPGPSNPVLSPGPPGLSEGWESGD